MVTAPTTPTGALRRKIDLVTPLVKRDILARYQGSIIGISWTFLVPLLMLGIYTFVFSGVLKMRWHSNSDFNQIESTIDFSLMLFIGLIIHSFASEVITRSPTIIISNSNLVKKVVFPIEILPLMTVISALFQFFVNFLVFITFFYFAKGLPSVNIFWLPVVILPFFTFLIGSAWLLSGITVYFRDISQIMGLLATVLLFLSPVFYPASMFPESLNFLFNINPLTFIIEQARVVTFNDVPPNFIGLGFYSLIAVIFCILGRVAFSAMRKGFSDVL